MKSKKIPYYKKAEETYTHVREAEKTLRKNYCEYPSEFKEIIGKIESSEFYLFNAIYFSCAAATLSWFSYLADYFIKKYLIQNPNILQEHLDIKFSLDDDEKKCVLLFQEKMEKYFKKL